MKKLARLMIFFFILFSVVALPGIVFASDGSTISVVDAVMSTENIWNMLIVTICSIILDAFFGFMLSLKKKEFSINKLPQFIARNILPYVGGLLVVALVALFVSDFIPVFIFLAGLVSLKFSKEALYDKIREWISL